MLEWLDRKASEVTDEQGLKIGRALLWAWDFIGAVACFAVPAMIVALCLVFAG